MIRAFIASAAAAVIVPGLVISAAAATDDEPSPPDGAVSATTWSVQPAGDDGADGRPFWEFELEPGESVDDVAALNNFGDEAVTFHVYSHDAVNSADGGFTLQPADAEPAEVGAWVGLDEEVTVEPGESVNVPFTLTVPDGAAPGDHAGGIVASVTQEATDAAGQRVLVDNRVGSRIYLRVAGDAAPQLEVADLKVTYDRSWVPFSTGSALISYDVRNVGNVRLAADQAVNGHGIFGLGKHQASLDPLKEVLPGESVTVSHEIGGVIPLFRLTEEAVVTPRLPASSSATVLPVVQASESVQVWSLPWPELILLGLVCLWLTWSGWRRRQDKKKNKAQVEEAVAKAREEVRRELEEAAAGGPSATNDQGSQS